MTVSTGARYMVVLAYIVQKHVELICAKLLIFNLP